MLSADLENVDRAALIDDERIQQRLTELVRIPSLGGDEETAIARVAEWLAETGAEVDLWHDDALALQLEPGYPGHEIPRSVVPVVAARLRGNRPGPAILLTGHVDVVPPGDVSQWSREPFSGVVDGDRLYGRGSCDMKAGLVAALEVLEAFRSRDFAGQIIVVAVPGEEDSGVGTFAAIHRGWRGDVAIIPEPTVVDGMPTLVVAHGGCMTVRLSIPGRSAHASRRLLGESSFEHYLRIHSALRQAETDVNALETNPLMLEHELPYATSVGMIQGGTFTCSVMDTLDVDIRMGVPLWESVTQTEARLQNLLREASAGSPWLADNPPKLTITSRHFGSASTPIGHPLVQQLAAAHRHVVGSEVRIRAATYACDMAGWVRLGEVPTVIYGPGDIEVAHAPDEWVSLKTTRLTAEVLSDAVERMTTGGLPDAEGGASVIPGPGR